MFEPPRVHCQILLEMEVGDRARILTPLLTPLERSPDLSWISQREPRLVSGDRELAAELQRRSLFDSMSNHMAKSANWEPETSSSAISTTVAEGIGLPRKRRIVSEIPSARPIPVIRKPSA